MATAPGCGNGGMSARPSSSTISETKTRCDPAREGRLELQHPLNGVVSDRAALSIFDRFFELAKVREADQDRRHTGFVQAEPDRQFNEALKPHFTCQCRDALRTIEGGRRGTVAHQVAALVARV